MKILNTILPFCCWLPGNTCANEGKLKSTDFGLPPVVADEVSGIRDRLVEIGNEILFREDWTRNTVISPSSIIGALYMLAAGTSGEANDELLQLLNIPSSDSTEKFRSYKLLMNYLLEERQASYELSIANGLFYDVSFPPTDEYSAILQELMMTNFSEFRSANFGQNPKATTDAINEWVKEKTKDKIPKMFEETIDSNTVAMILSSLYFKGSWEVPFDIVKYRYYCWNAPGAECNHDIQFMAADNYFATLWDDAYTVVDVPLTKPCDKKKCNKKSEVENIMTFQIWIPSNVLSTLEDHQQFQRRIQNDMPNIRAKMHEQRINLVMPKMSLGFKNDLKQSFFDLGVRKVFQAGPHFAPIFGEDNAVDIAVSQIQHAVKLDIDEDGIEGAATTAIGMMFRSMPPDVVADRPFYFTIASDCRTSGENAFDREKVSDTACVHRGTPIFAGKVVDIDDAIKNIK
jgi:serpin B